jgi:Flp pilus assembly protein TadD
LEAYKTAIPLAAKELAIDPSDWRATGRLGLYYVHTGRLDEANAQLEQLLKLTPNATAYYWASLISLGLKRIDAADHYLQQSADGGWSEKLLTRDPDLVALRGYKAYEELMNQATK